MLRQKLQQKLLQKLSPQQIQFIKLLQVPTVMLDARIKEELEDNPALEDPSLLSAEREEEYEELDEKHNEETAQEERTEDDVNIDDYLQDDDRSEEHTSESQSLMRIAYAVYCLKKKKT